MLSREKTNNPIALKEYQIEQDIISRINHEHILDLLGSGSVPRPFMIFEPLKIISGMLDFDLKNDRRLTIMKKKNPFTFLEILNIAKSLASALKYIHIDIHDSMMIINRDLKPDNLGFAADGKIKLFDFGLAKCIRKKSFPDETFKMTGATGSLRYMAPEVFHHHSYNESVDVYSYSLVIWAIVSNELPFKTYDLKTHKSNVMEKGERPKLSSSWPSTFSQLLSDCWSYDLRKRPNFNEICLRLDEIIIATQSSIQK